MGSGARGIKSLVKGRKRQDTYSHNSDDFSDVDSHTTKMSDEDRKIVDSNYNSNGYFQTWNAFEINEALRYAHDNNVSIEDGITKTGDNVEKQMQTIDAMDRNMKPTNKDMNVIRLADSNYLNRVLSGAVQSGVLNQDVADRLEDFAKGFKGKISDSDLSALKSALVGGTIHENAYASCTYNLSLKDSAFTGRKIKLDMDVKAGTKGMFSPTGRESEFVLDRHSGYDVSDVYIGEDGRLVIKVST